MYALTHTKIIAALITAHQKGVNVAIFLDGKMASGTCSKYLTPLTAAGVPLYKRTKFGLMHHKSALIDNTYIFGSTNWSASGFNKNEETLIFLQNLSKKDQCDILKFFKNILYYSHRL